MDVKPGYLTTEFWVTLLTQVLAAVTALAGLFGHNLDGSKLQPLIPVAALLAAAIAAGLYAHSRAKVKAAAPYAFPAPAPLVVPPNQGN